jgi:hypothetical protein
MGRGHTGREGQSSLLPSSVNKLYDTMTIGMVDYDYAAGYGGTGDMLLSDIGGTVSSPTFRTAANGLEVELPKTTALRQLP